MEAKYLKDQDTGEIFYPIIHVDGVAGLSVSRGTDTLVERNFALPTNPYMSTSTNLIYREYINMIYVAIQGDLKTDAKQALRTEGRFSLDLPPTFPVCTVNLNIICRTSEGLHPYCTATGRIMDRVLEISAIVNEPVYQIVDDVVQESYTFHDIDTIMGCGFN